MPRNLYSFIHALIENACSKGQILRRSKRSVRLCSVKESEMRTSGQSYLAVHNQGVLLSAFQPKSMPLSVFVRDDFIPNILSFFCAVDIPVCEHMRIDKTTMDSFALGLDSFRATTDCKLLNGNIFARLWQWCYPRHILQSRGQCKVKGCESAFHLRINRYNTEEGTFLALQLKINWAFKALKTL